MNKHGAPPRVVQTLPVKIIGGPAPPGVYTTAPPRVARRSTSKYQMVGTLKTPAPNIPSVLTKRYKARYRKTSILPQKEMILLQKLTETEITHLFSGLVVTEGQYRL